MNIKVDTDKTKEYEANMSCRVMYALQKATGNVIYMDGDNEYDIHALELYACGGIGNDEKVSELLKSNIPLDLCKNAHLRNAIYNNNIDHIKYVYEPQYISDMIDKYDMMDIVKNNCNDILKWLLHENCITPPDIVHIDNLTLEETATLWSMYSYDVFVKDGEIIDQTEDNMVHICDNDDINTILSMLTVKQPLPNTTHDFIKRMLLDGTCNHTYIKFIDNFNNNDVPKLHANYGSDAFIDENTVYKTIILGRLSHKVISNVLSNRDDPESIIYDIFTLHNAHNVRISSINRAKVYVQYITTPELMKYFMNILSDTIMKTNTICDLCNVNELFLSCCFKFNKVKLWHHTLILHYHDMYDCRQVMIDKAIKGIWFTDHIKYLHMHDYHDLLSYVFEYYYKKDGINKCIEIITKNNLTNVIALKLMIGRHESIYVDYIDDDNIRKLINHVGSSIITKLRFNGISSQQLYHQTIYYGIKNKKLSLSFLIEYEKMLSELLSEQYHDRIYYIHKDIKEWIKKLKISKKKKNKVYEKMLKNIGGCEHKCEHEYEHEYEHSILDKMQNCWNKWKNWNRRNGNEYTKVDSIKSIQVYTLESSDT
jgi:hypothetical protein